MFSGLTSKAKQVLEKDCHKIAKSMGYKIVLPEHLFISLLEDTEGICHHLLERLGVDIEDLLEDIDLFLYENINNQSKKSILGDIPVSDRMKKVLDYSKEESNSLKHKYIGMEHLFLGIFREGNRVYELLNERGIYLKIIYKTIVEMVGYGKIPNDENELVPLGIDYFNRVKNFDKKNNFQKLSINKFARNLNKDAENGLIDEVIARQEEIERMIQILCRRTKNNPLLIGDPGVGKTAIVQGLALKIVQGEVPDLLKDKVIFELNLAECLAGTRYRGDFEEKMNRIIKDVKHNKNIILFIDEVHTLLGSGNSEGGMDASNMMKPALAKGELRCIGATTFEEYRKYLERDSALSRRFLKVNVNEPSIENAIEILKGLKSTYEKFHFISLSEDVIKRIVKYSKRYFPDKKLPDIAIDIIDELGAKKKISNHNKPANIINSHEELKILEVKKQESIGNQEYEEAANIRDLIKNKKEELVKEEKNWFEKSRKEKKIITIRDLNSAIEKMTKIPVSELEDNQKQRLLHIEKTLNEKIIGQKHAVRKVANAFKRSQVGIRNPNRPIASFIFLGTTGVGKTALAKILASFVFGREDALIKLDMSEYMEKHNASKLIGAPPGYVGYEQGGLLTDKVRQNPYSVILLDEIEKAHRDIFNVLLQILEDGYVTDNYNNRIDFTNTIIIMTSNIGSKFLSSNISLGFQHGDKKIQVAEKEEMVLEELKNQFRPEFLNRVTDKIVFNTLRSSDLFKIIEIELEILKQRLIEKNIILSWDDLFKKYILKKGYSSEYGARPIQRTIERELEDEIANFLIANKSYRNSKFICEVLVSVKKGKVLLEINKTKQKKIN